MCYWGASACGIDDPFSKSSTYPLAHMEDAMLGEAVFDNELSAKRPDHRIVTVTELADGGR